MSPRQPLFYIRADSSLRMGGGHIYRCLSLAESLRNLGAEVIFLCRELKGNLVELVASSGFRCEKLSAYDETGEFHWQEDAALSLAAIKESPKVLIVDHYSIDSRWESAVAKKCPRILAIDDIADRAHHCTWLLDGGYVANAERRYEKLVNNNTALLLGPAFALIRPQFSAARASLKRDYSKAKEVLAYFGSGAPADCTLRFVQSLASLKLENVSVKILLGEKDPVRPKILAAVKTLPFVSVLPTTPDMATLLAAADIYVGSGGMISWERACLGLPSVSVTVAENQVPSTAHLAETGHILYLGPVEKVSSEAYLSAITLLLESETLRKMLGQSSAGLVDGLGAGRVAKILFGEAVTLRPATMADRELIFEWRNHKSARANSMNPAPISHETHNAWYAKVMQDPERAVLMAESLGKTVGTLRLERKGNATLVSIFLDPQWHRRGFGPSILMAGKEWVRKNWPDISKLEAHIKEGNAPSISAFKRAGYRKAWSAYIADL